MKDRSITSFAPRLNELRSKATDEAAIPGTEGLHREDNSAAIPAPRIPDGPIHGDWVLFHPVYSPEELKAVQVCIPISSSRFIHFYNFIKVLHREARTFSDKLSIFLVKFARYVVFYTRNSATLNWVL